MNPLNGKKNLSPGMTLALVLLLMLAAGTALWLAGSRQGLDKVYATTLRKGRLVADMRGDLFTAAEAEKNAVLADTDQASRDFAQQARASRDKVAAGLKTLQDLADSGPEGGLLRRFEEAFAEYRKADEEVLGLAVQNTNLKALALSFGPASAALDELGQALKPLQDGPNDRQARLALRAFSAALRIQALHAPHIMEKTDPRMDALERDMAGADAAVRAALAALGREPAAARALAAYEGYWKLTAEILGLSRRNTNVRSFALSLERKTRVLAACDEALRMLEENVRERMGNTGTR